MEKNFISMRTEKSIAFLLKGKRAAGKEKELEMYVDYYKAM